MLVQFLAMMGRKPTIMFASGSDSINNLVVQDVKNEKMRFLIRFESATKPNKTENYPYHSQAIAIY
ncbi:MAG: hypothetical protein QNJ63_20430 [Calothrix sp. MO_192.B10]|nr:hypothetical protein [Calothrix sp. MO_192.B10]